MCAFAEKINKILDKTLFPERLSCDLCGRDVYNGEFLCHFCRETVTFLNDDICKRCGREDSTRPEHCRSCGGEKFVDLSRSVFLYEDGGEKLVKKLKYGNGRYLAKRFAEYFRDIYVKNSFAPDLLTFVPMTGGDLYERGFNQTELIAKELSKLVGVPVLSALEKVRKTPPQAGLDFEERQKNLKGVYVFKKGVNVKNKKILLIDDVLTTGATSSEIASVLKGRGAKSVYLLTIASVNLEYLKNN